MTNELKSLLPSETAVERYARQTRNATVFIAWAVGIALVAGLILGIVATVDMSRLLTAVTAPQI
jgi:hypothetical protein